jgi:dienelactone hydrolase
VSRRQTVAALAVCAFSLWAAPAHATVAGTLHGPANCSTITPIPGTDVKKCDDGIPNAGGLFPNFSGESAVTVPAKYGGDGYTGLPEKAGDAGSMPGANPATGEVALDVDVTLPTSAPPAGGYPLIVLMHGCCSGDKTGWEATSFDAGGERWHYNNVWFASRGYAVITYTARGFVNGQNRGSTGETQLDSRSFEINDFQHLACQVLGNASQWDDVTGTSVSINPDRVVVSGGSYGGGFSWLALTDPRWTCTADTGAGGTAMSLAAAAPKYGWTDLVYSLVPTGTHLQQPGALPDTGGCDSGPLQFDGSECPGGGTPVGMPKESIITLLYTSGRTGLPPDFKHTTFSEEIDASFACLSEAQPYPPVGPCEGVLANSLVSFLRERSAYYQEQFFQNIASDPTYRVPVFNAATFTDPLFTPVENRRMLNRLRSVVPDYPIQTYHGDVQHFVQNKAKEWADLCSDHVCEVGEYPNGGASPSDFNSDPAGLTRTGVTTRLNRFMDHYAKPEANPSEPQPAFNVTASLQVCPQNAAGLGVAADEPGPQFNAPTFEELAPNVLEVNMPGPSSTTSKAVPNLHAVRADPAGNFLSNGGRCPRETDVAGAGVASYISDPLPSDQTMIGATTVEIDFTSTGGDPGQSGLQLNGRLYDVAPSGEALMVDRGVRRVSHASTITYQLHGNGWLFPAGHRIRIEIAQDDSPFVRFSTPPSGTSLSAVRLRIPVREGGSIGGGPEGPCANVRKGTRKRDKLRGTDRGDKIKGRRGNDRIKGLDGDDCLKGNSGRDRVKGNGDDDVISGGKGRDNLLGGGGRDKIKARGGGRDRIHCGKGKDKAVVDRRDRVKACEKVRRGGRGK